MTKVRLFILIILSSVLVSEAHALTLFQEVKDSYTTSEALLLDRHGEVIHELRIDPRGRRLEWVSLMDISPSLIKAVIHSEDRRFHEHRGVDWRALGSSAVKNLFSARPRGASTITMQLVSLLNSRLTKYNSRRTLGEKWLQIEAARALEKGWSKDEVIEAYLNLITFRGELQGVASASRGLFGKEPSGLDEAESCVLASLIRSPNASIEMVSKRACILSGSLDTSASCESIQRLTGSTLSKLPRIRYHADLAPHVARELLPRGQQGSASRKGDMRIRSTLDGILQRFVSETLKGQLRTLGNHNVRDGAILVVENRTGEVLAYVANTGSDSSANQVDGIRAKRQAGSTLKPFLYALALDRKIMTAASLIDDEPLDIPTGRGIYRPENYDKEFRDIVTVREALGSSLNIPAVKTITLVGVDFFVKRLRQLGFQDLRGDEFYGPSLALGSADVSLRELVNAYRALSNGGVWSRLALTHGQRHRERKRIFSRGTSFIISNILSDREARSSTFSLENPLATKFWTAVKTGTSKDMRDNWCIGYSERYTVGVWVGNFSGAPMWNVSGISGAAPLWLEVMNYLHRNTPSRPSQSPDTLVLREITFRKGLPSKKEWFIRGTEPEEIVVSASSPSQKIVYPPDEGTITLDPDIPPDRQKVMFESEREHRSMKWMLNGNLFEGAGTVLWTPERGLHSLALIDRENRIVDQVTFIVK